VESSAQAGLERCEQVRRSSAAGVNRLADLARLDVPGARSAEDEDHHSGDDPGCDQEDLGLSFDDL
jgi:hypothetical protein